VAVTEERPESALDAVEAFATLLDDVDPGVAGPAVDALGELAAEDPAAVEPVSERLRACLEHDRSSVRARAIGAVGRLGDSRAVPTLRAIADGDEDEDVREIAAETADFLTNS
jgi:HEAT repeat protein